MLTEADALLHQPLGARFAQPVPEHTRGRVVTVLVHGEADLRVAQLFLPEQRALLAGTEEVGSPVRSEPHSARVRATNVERLPAWIREESVQGWLFVDEIVVGAERRELSVTLLVPHRHLQPARSRWLRSGELHWLDRRRVPKISGPCRRPRFRTARRATSTGC